MSCARVGNNWYVSYSLILIFIIILNYYLILLYYVIFNYCIQLLFKIIILYYTELLYSIIIFNYIIIDDVENDLLTAAIMKLSETNEFS